MFEKPKKLMKPIKKTYLETVEEVVDDFISKINDEDKEYIKTIEMKELIDLHSYTGRDIRNNYGLWNYKKSKKLLENCLRVQKEKNPEEHKEYQEFYKDKPSIKWPMHPDDASGLILEEIWRKLNDNKNSDEAS